MLSIDQLIRDYGDPQAEARSCRQDCALFDFSFVYRARASGRDAIRKIEQFQPRKVADMSVGQLRYSVKNDAGGRVRSDLTLWRLADEVFEIMSGCSTDIVELLSLQERGFKVDDLSETTAILALQGPNTMACLARHMDVGSIMTLPYFHFVEAEIGGVACVIGRLGYSGEQGVEILIEQTRKAWLWELLCEQAAPAGFAAIDILRIEAGFFLFTNECRILPTISELGLSRLLDDGGAKPEIRLTAFKSETQGEVDLTLWQPSSDLVRRPGFNEISVTSACYSPHFDQAIGLGFIPAEHDGSYISDPQNAFTNIEVFGPALIDSCKIRPRQSWRTE
jgi:glycine cleavage system aminomethyltransferase T